METLIKVRPDELKMELLNKIRLLAEENEDVEILIHVRDKLSHSLAVEEGNEYLLQLEKSIKEAEQGKITSFTAEEFEKYVNDNFSL